MVGTYCPYRFASISISASPIRPVIFLGVIIPISNDNRSTDLGGDAECKQKLTSVIDLIPAGVPWFALYDRFMAD